MSYNCALLCTQEQWRANRTSYTVWVLSTVYTSSHYFSRTIRSKKSCHFSRQASAVYWSKTRTPNPVLLLPSYIPPLMTPSCTDVPGELFLLMLWVKHRGLSTASLTCPLPWPLLGMFWEIVIYSLLSVPSVSRCVSQCCDLLSSQCTECITVCVTVLWYALLSGNNVCISQCSSVYVSACVFATCAYACMPVNVSCIFMHVCMLLHMTQKYTHIAQHVLVHASHESHREQHCSNKCMRIPKSISLFVLDLIV